LTVAVLRLDSAIRMTIGEMILENLCR
jgi:hypothetical protein